MPRSSSRQALAAADLAAIVTAHPGIDYRSLAGQVAILIDFRGVTRGLQADNLLRL